MYMKETSQTSHSWKHSARVNCHHWYYRLADSYKKSLVEVFSAKGTILGIRAKDIFFSQKDMAYLLFCYWIHDCKDNFSYLFDVQFYHFLSLYVTLLEDNIMYWILKIT